MRRNNRYNVTKRQRRKESNMRLKENLIFHEPLLLNGEHHEETWERHKRIIAWCIILMTLGVGAIAFIIAFVHTVKL